MTRESWEESSTRSRFVECLRTFGADMAELRQGCVAASEAFQQFGEYAATLRRLRS